MSLGDIIFIPAEYKRMGSLVFFNPYFYTTQSQLTSTPVVQVDPTNIFPSPYTYSASLVSNSYYNFTGGQRIDFSFSPYLTPFTTGMTFFIKFRMNGTAADAESIFCFDKIGSGTGTNPFNGVDIALNVSDEIRLGRNGTEASIRPAFSSASNYPSLVNPTVGTITQGTDYILAVRWTGSTSNADTAYSLSYWITTASNLSGASKNKTQSVAANCPGDGWYQLSGIGHQNQRNGYGFFNGFIYYLYIFNESWSDSRITSFDPANVTSVNYEYPSRSLLSGTLTNSNNTYTQTVSGYIVGNGTYTCNTSSYLASENAFGRYAFDKIWGASAQSWASTNNYTGFGGTYAGSTTTTVSGNTVLGEWIQMSFPSGFVCKSYSLLARSDQFYNRIPRNFLLAGSNDGTTWTSIDTETNITCTYPGQRLLFDVGTNSTSYSVYRLIGTLANRDNLVSISDFTFYNNTNISPTPNYTFLSNVLSLTPMHVFSTVKLIGSYSGPVLNIKNGSISATGMDFYSDQNGNLSNLAGISLQSYLGANTGYISIFYNQVTGSNNFVQSAGGTDMPIVRFYGNDTYVSFNFASTSNAMSLNISNAVTINNGSFYTSYVPTSLPAATSATAWTLSDSLFYGERTTVVNDFSIVSYQNASNVIVGLGSGAAGVDLTQPVANISLNSLASISLLRQYPASNLSVIFSGPSPIQTANTGTTSIVSLVPASLGKFNFRGDLKTLIFANTEFSENDMWYLNYFNRFTNPVQIEYPPAALTSNTTTLSGLAYGNGIYRASGSTEVWPAFRAFDKNVPPTTAGGATATNSWAGNSNYNSSGAYTGAISTTIDGSSYAGEWLQIQLPNSIVLTAYQLNRGENGRTWNPSTFYLAGSNNGSTWSMLDSKSGITTAQWGVTGTNQAYTINLTNATAYSYYRIVVNKVQGLDFVLLGEVRLYTLTPVR